MRLNPKVGISGKAKEFLAFSNTAERVGFHFYLELITCML